MLKRFSKDDYGPIRSDYLSTGYREDDFELTSVMVEEKRVLGAV